MSDLAQVRSVIAQKCPQVRHFGFMWNGITPKHFKCDGRASQKNTFACLDKAYERFLKMTRLYQTSFQEREIDEALMNLGLASLNYEKARLPAILGMTALGSDHFSELFLKSSQYKYLFEEEGETQVHANYTSAVVYAACVQEYPKPGRYRIRGNRALAGR
ncbi:MAG: hypothetical protein COX62_08065 [Deltaproteobacteria bacterium CG_4_10_14_0_2_um_filter_43_8]|nr:MAG: hypothetical protein COX62_08065 [Deltaproteobacteria bacterium CG_4_10_14_0_2_um_filter_43_8]PJC64849.1 MAG: hypothetical protein CO021_02195 [Deltaproteobacteria bacterium CG_4_9_14_0_2_um_filter_42_21]